MRSKKILIVFVSAFLLLLPSISDFLLAPNSLPYSAMMYGPLSKMTYAKSGTAGYPQLILNYIAQCNHFPAYLENVIHKNEKTEMCNKVADINEIPKKLINQIDLVYQNYKGWIDPWGRPYQIRYDLERAKLQVRSQGRYLWITWDDIVGETYFDGKAYKNQVEYCKTVSKDDMSCIFNRGWH